MVARRGGPTATSPCNGHPCNGLPCNEGPTLTGRRLRSAAGQPGADPRATQKKPLPTSPKEALLRPRGLSRAPSSQKPGHPCSPSGHPALAGSAAAGGTAPPVDPKGSHLRDASGPAPGRPAWTGPGRTRHRGAPASTRAAAPSGSGAELLGPAARAMRDRSAHNAVPPDIPQPRPVKSARCTLAGCG